MDSNVETIAADVWKELEEASRIEAPLNIKPFYDDMIKREDPKKKSLLTSRSHRKLLWMNSSLFQQSTTGVLT